MQVAEDLAKGVPELAISLAQPGEDVSDMPHVFVEKWTEDAQRRRTSAPWLR